MTQRPEHGDMHCDALDDLLDALDRLAAARDVDGAVDAVRSEAGRLIAELESRVRERTESLEREVAARRRAEAWLSESRTRFASVVESAMDAIISIDAAQRIVFFNAAAEAMFGWRAGDIVGRPLDCLIPARFRAGHAARVSEFIRDGVTSRRMGELQALAGLRADGSEFPIEAAIAKVELATGTLATVIVRDIGRRVAAEAALARSTARLRYVTHAAGIGYWDWDISAGRLEWSERCRAMFGLLPSEVVTYELFLDALHPDDRAHVAAAVEAALVRGSDYDVEFRPARAGAGARWVQSKGRATLGLDGKPVRMGGIVIDVTARKEMEAALRDSEARFREMADTAPAMLWVTDAEGVCTFLSRGWYDYTGQSEDDGLGFGWLDAVHPDERAIVGAGFLSASGDRRAFEHEHRLRCADGAFRWVLDAGRPRFSRDGGFLGFIGSVIDIHDRKEAEQVIRMTALHDPLTGLPNRALTHEFAAQLLAGSRRGGGRSAVMFVDLDRFKPVNDTYGHCVGDEVLRDVARRLASCVRAEDVVGRLGGDEFLVVLSHLHVVEEAARVAVDVLASLSEPYDVERAGGEGRTQVDISPSIGISIHPDDGDDLATLIERADRAMYAAKAAGRGTFRFYADADPPPNLR